MFNGSENMAFLLGTIVLKVVLKTNLKKILEKSENLQTI